MAIPPDPSSLYPDVAHQGSLGAALRFAAGGVLFAIPIASSESEPLTHAAVSCAVPHRLPLQIDGWRHERCWSIRGADAFDNMALIEGRTADLAAVAAVARAWHDGETLREISDAAPFVHLTGRFDLRDPDPARRMESEWQHLRLEATELSSSWSPAYRSLVEAAFAEPALRDLYPFTSHWVLRFSATTRPQLTPTGPCLTANSDGTYGVGKSIVAQDLGLCATAREAVALAVRNLPGVADPKTR
ncbi:DUF6193 family natural product biosynthesis protein [Streptomyces sp. KL116D]|uniref:DUF6193 family natural product biosynthesis protein n=1 Tax=Streptomyces sp. KL116D TaxID=3045152 RepID=UPI003558B2A3